MSVVKKIVLGLACLAALLFFAGLLLPGREELERSAVIDAPAHVVFGVLDGFESYREWWPWSSLVVEDEVVIEGPVAGAGSRMSWTSRNPQIGSGYQEIVTSEPVKRIESRLVLGQERSCELVYQIEPGDQATLVRWRAARNLGRNPVERYLGLMFERWMSPDFESGLRRLQAFAEGLPRADWTDLEIEVVDVNAQPLILVSSASSWDVEEIGKAFSAAKKEVLRFIESRELEPVGPPVAITTSMNEQEWRFDVGIPVAAPPEDGQLEPESVVKVGETPRGRVVRTTSVGPYGNLSSEWEKTRAWAVVHGLEEAGLGWEEYVSDPASSPEDQLITRLFLPVE
jgi:effector-binding domain-containing protein